MGNGISASVTSNGVAVIEPAWLDNKRPLFTLALEPVSTMYTLDDKLARFFDTCSRKLAVYTGSVEESGNIGSAVRVGG